MLWSTVTKVLVLLQAGIIGHKYTFIACFLATGEFVTIYGLRNNLSIIALVDIDYFEGFYSLRITIGHLLAFDPAQ